MQEATANEYISDCLCLPLQVCTRRRTYSSTSSPKTHSHVVLSRFSFLHTADRVVCLAVRPLTCTFGSVKRFLKIFGLSIVPLGLTPVFWCSNLYLRVNKNKFGSKSIRKLEVIQTFSWRHDSSYTLRACICPCVCVCVCVCGVYLLSVNCNYVWHVSNKRTKVSHINIVKNITSDHIVVVACLLLLSVTTTSC